MFNIVTPARGFVPLVTLSCVLCRLSSANLKCLYALSATQLGAQKGALGESVYKRLEAALIAFATLSGPAAGHATAARAAWLRAGGHV